MNNTSLTIDRLKCCSVNIDRMSDTSRALLDIYNDKEQIDFLFVQETGSNNKEKLNLTNMRVITDSNQATNRGAALFIRDKYVITDLKEISSVSKNIDSAWALIIVNNKRYVLGSVYARLHYDDAIKDIIKMLIHHRSQDHGHKFIM